MFQEKCKFYVFNSTFDSISFVSNFKSSTTLTSNTDRSRTVTLIAPTIDISPQKAVLTTQYPVVQAKCNKNTTNKKAVKDDRAMRPIYCCPENFRESLTMSTPPCLHNF